MKRLAFVGLVVALASNTASAQVLLNDNFDNENGGNTQFNFAGFTNWSVTGQVDYLNNFGIACALGSSGCVDLDGSGGPGYMRTLSTFSFNAGETMRISFDLSGNQRGGNDDPWTLALLFGGVTDGSFLGGGAFTGLSGGPFGGVNSITFNRSIAPGAPYASYSMDFLAISAGTLQYEIGTSSADNIGPILDNVLIERFGARTVVPEPSTYAMLALGMSAMGIAARRRRKV